MKNNNISLAVFLLGTAVCLVDAAPAQANFSECGGAYFSGDARCEFRKTEQCMTECKTETVQKACTAKLYVSCDNQCTASASTSCESSCGQVCTTDCTKQVSQPEPPDCLGLCKSDCEKTCDGGRGRRGSCCDHSCNAKCEDRCKNAPAPATKPAECTETCTNACSGSCTAQANVTCQVDCQTDVYTECETELVETCETKCMEEGGAIFCDGQFVNAASAKSCADELKAKLDFNINIDISGEISGVVDVVGDGTKDTVNTTKKKSKELCSVSHVGAAGGGTGAALLLGACATALGVSRKRRSRSAR